MKQDKPTDEKTPTDARRTKADSPTGSHWMESSVIAVEAFPRLDEARQRSVRLVVSIPVLILLIVLGSGIAAYWYLMRVADSQGIQTDPTSRTVAVDPARARPTEPHPDRVPPSQTLTVDKLETMALATLLISAALSLLGAVIGYILARQIVRPIRGMTEMMEQIAQGNFSSQLTPFSLGEFGQLGFTFNRMVEQLNKLFEERDRQLRESFSGAHLLIDSDGIILQADAAARRIFGEAGTDLVGKNLIHNTDNIPILKSQPRFKKSMDEVLMDAIAGKSSNRSVTVRNGDAYSRFLVSTLPFEGSSESEHSILLEVRDISAIASFYEQMQRADRLAAVGTLATGIAHEIRNPLASIRGMVQLMSEAPAETNEDRQRYTDYTRRILKEVDRLEKLIAGIMDFAQSQDAPAERVDLNQLLEEVTEAARQHGGEDALKVPIKWELDRSIPPAELQGERLRQALLNLLVNAFQHCALNNCGPVHIQTIHLPVNPQRPLIIGISNPCDPIDEEGRERLFEPFFTTKPEGTGLGLPIAYQTIASNGGVLEMEWEEGQLHFWIRLPKENRAARLGSNSGIFAASLKGAKNKRPRDMEPS